MWFDQGNSAASTASPVAGFAARSRSFFHYAAIFVLVSAATTAMMVCPCDTVGIHDHYAVSLLTIAAICDLSAAFLIYLRLRRDSGITPFLKVLISLAIAGFGLYAELFAAMKVVAWLARPR